MFSATFASETQNMATAYLKSDYIFVAVGEIGGACKDVIQTIIEVTKFNKKEELFSLLKDLGLFFILNMFNVPVKNCSANVYLSFN